MPEREVNVDELMAQVRAEVARRHGRRGDDAGASLLPDRPQIDSQLDDAATAAHIGTVVPAFIVFGPVRRRLARAVTRLLYYFLQVITVDQRRFNQGIVNALRTLIAGMQQGETALDARLLQIEQVLARQDAELQAQRREIGALVEALTSRAPADDGPPGASDATRNTDHGSWITHHASRNTQHASHLALDGHLLDGLRANLEDRLRGPYAVVKERLRVHLPWVREHAGTADRPILDLGCGRGEWLDLLREAGLRARGVDRNAVLVQRCRARGFEVSETDALTYLRHLPDRSLGAITAFHLLEHLPFTQLVHLLDESARVLHPGGVVVIETPNPENLVVGACSFYADPTHERPLVPLTLQLLLELYGFDRVRMWRLNGDPKLEPPPLLPGEDPLASRLNPLLDLARHHLFTPPCLAVVAAKPV